MSQSPERGRDSHTEDRRDDYHEDRREERGRGRSRSRSAEKEPASLLVRNVSFRVSPEELRKVFEKYGDVRDVYIPLDYHSQRPRGFAFVEFQDARDAR